MNPDLVTQVLSSQNALDRIAEIRQKLQREKNVIDSQLQAGVEAQSKLLSSGMGLLVSARSEIGQVQNNMRDLHNLHQHSVKSVQDFERIQKLSNVAANFDLVQMFVHNFETLHDDLRNISALLDRDGEFDIDSKMPNLLPVHFLLSQVRELKDQAVRYAQDSSYDVRQTIGRHFAQLDSIVDRFDSIVFDAASCLLEILRTGDRSLVVRVAKVIDFEERQDLLSNVTSRMKSPGNMAAIQSNLSAEFGSSQKLRNLAPRAYYERFKRAIEASIDEIFTNCMDHFSPENNPKELLENVDWIYNDLLQAKQQLVPCVPERWKIFDLYVSYYHKGTYRMLDTIMRFEPTAQTILQVLQFVKDHYKILSAEFGVAKESLTPALLDGREKVLYDEYLALLVSKLKEWYATIAVTEKKPFITRSTPPEKHNDNTLGLDGHTTMFRLVAQQLETAANSGQSRIVVGSVDACCDILKQRGLQWIGTLESEVTRELAVADPDSEEVPRGLFEYIMALANDQSRAHDDLEQLSAKWSAMLKGKYRTLVQNRFAEAQADYFDITKACIKGMLQIIVNDLKPALALIFVDAKWYNGVAMGQICATLVEFIDDANRLMLPDLFDVFVLQLCKEVTLEYLRVMPRAQGKVKSPSGYERVLEDIAALYDLFSNEEYEMETEDIQEVFKVLECLCDTLQTDLAGMSDRFLQLRESFWDAPLDLFEHMMGLSKVHDKKHLRETMAGIRLVAVRTQKEVPDEQQHPTFLQNYRRV